jgi:hypothetical protein
MDKIVSLLIEALQDPRSRSETIKEAQSLVWDLRKVSMNAEVYDVLADLAYDLDFFEPNQEMRKEDPSFYGEERLEEEIRVALRKLARLGISVP